MIRAKQHKRTGTIVGTGLIALDLVYAEGSELPRIWAGGTCGNVLAILAYLGWTAVPISRLDSGDPSIAIEDDLSRWGVYSSFLHVDKPAPAPIVVEHLRTTRGGQPVHRFSFKCPNCGRWLPSYKPVTAAAVSEVASRLPDPDVFFFDRTSRGALDLASRLKQRGAAIVFEPSSVGNPRLFEQALRVADIVKYSVERLDFLDLPEAQSGPWLEVVTLGEDGLRYRRRTRSSRMGRWRDQAASPVSKTIDTAGAGDWATALLLHQLKGSRGAMSAADDSGLDHALRFAQAAAAWASQFEGARGGMYAASPDEFERAVGAITRQKTVVNEMGEREGVIRKLPPSVCPSCS